MEETLLQHSMPWNSPGICFSEGTAKKNKEFIFPFLFSDLKLFLTAWVGVLVLCASGCMNTDAVC